MTNLNFVYAMTPKYVGINENSTYIWRTKYEKDPLKDYYEDDGRDPESVELNERNEAIKIVILSIDSEEDDSFGSEGVMIIYNYYITKQSNLNDWIRKEKDETFAIFDEDEIEIYANLIMGGLKYDKNGLETGIVPYFVSNSLDWDDLKDFIKFTYKENNYDTIKIRKEENEIGFHIVVDKNDDDKVEEMDYFFKYSKDGVLMYYEWQYDGDTIIKVNLEGEFFYEYGVWIILGIISLIALIIIIIIKIKFK